MRNDAGRRWYLSILAGLYLFLCTAGSVYYLSLRLYPERGAVPFVQEGLCLAFAVSAGLYFFRARLGRIALTFLTVVSLVAIGNSAPSATAFHLGVMVILMIPVFPRRNYGTSRPTLLSN